MTGRRHRAQFAALPDLGLSPLEVFAQRLLQPFPSRVLRRDVGSFTVVLSIGHREIIRHARAGNPSPELSSQTHRPASLSRQMLAGSRGAAGLPSRIWRQLTELKGYRRPGASPPPFGGRWPNPALAWRGALWQRTPTCRGLHGRFWQPRVCCRSSVVEHSIGNGEVDSSILSGSTILG